MNRFLSCLALGCAFALSPVPSSTSHAGDLSGTVYGPDGSTPIPGASVTLLQKIPAWFGSGFYWDWAGQTSADGSGFFAFTSLSGGDYTLLVEESSGGLVNEYYHDAYSEFDALAIPVPEIGSVTGINFSLQTAGKISGTVTESNGGEPIGGISIYAYRWVGNGWIQHSGGQTVTAIDGTYTAGGLLTGALYRIWFDPPGGSEFLLETYYDFPGYPWDGGADILVATTATVEDIDAALGAASTISGRVTEMDGVTPISGVEVYAYKWDGWWWSWNVSATTDSNGDYLLTGLRAEPHRVEFKDPWNGNYLTETYDDFPGDARDGGYLITPPAGGAVTGINASLERASMISGTVTGPDQVTPLESINVNAYQWDGSGWAWINGTQTDTNGEYTITGLRGSAYRVEFIDWNYSLYAPQVYYNAPDLDRGEDILVFPDSTVADINASLVLCSSISGVVYQPDGITPQAGVRVRARRTFDNNLARSAISDEFGAYILTGLGPDTYVIHTDMTSDRAFLGQWHTGLLYVSGTTAPTGATEVVLMGGDALTGYDFTLQAAGRISGTVTGAGIVPITNARVVAYATVYGASAKMTDETGAFEIRGLYPDNYFVKVEAPGFQDEWWEEQAQLSGAETEAIMSGDHLVMNFDLAPGEGSSLLYVTSEPTGAVVYLNFQMTTNITPTMLDVGESGAFDSLGNERAPFTVTVRKDGYVHPSPQTFSPDEAETLELHFNLTNEAAGAVSVETTPAGTEVFVDVANAAAGLSPIVVGNLAPGSHVILLRKPGYLQPRPIVAWVSASETNNIVIPLDIDTSTNRLIVAAQSVPTGTTVYVDYLPTGTVTDVVVDWMDAASHTSTDWHSIRHLLLFKRNGFRPLAPRYVPEVTNELQVMQVNLAVDPNTATDGNSDGLPDEWQEAYGLNDLPPEDAGTDGDPDGDGVSNEEEMKAGTNPMDANSAFLVDQAPAPSGNVFSITFNTVPGRSYIVMCTGNLLSPWTLASGIITATSSQTTWTTTLPDGETCSYFQALVLTP